MRSLRLFLLLISNISPSMITSSKVFDHMLAGPKCEGQDGHRSGLVRRIYKDAGVTNVKIGDVMSLPEAVGDKFFGIVAHATGPSLVIAFSRPEGFLANTPKLSSRRFQNLRNDLLGVFPHGKLIGPPVKVDSESRYPNNVFHLRI